MIICPKCGGSQIVKNGFSYDEKQNFKCKACGRQFVENGQQNQISAETKQLIDKLMRCGHLEGEKIISNG